MSIGFSIEVGLDGSDDSEGYTVKRKGSCVYVQGSMPLEDLGVLLKGKKKHVMSPYLAEKFQAVIFCGPPDEVDALVAQFKSEDKKNFEASLLAGESPAKAWLKSGDVGRSSSFMCKFLCGFETTDSEVYAPADYDDFQRCEGMLRCVPGLREKLGALAVIPSFSRLVTIWGQLAPFVDLAAANKDGFLTKEQYAQFNAIFRH